MTLIARLTVWFAAHPADELSTRQIANRYGLKDTRAVHAGLRYAVGKGWFAHRPHPARRQRLYRAGERLLKELALNAEWRNQR